MDMQFQLSVLQGSAAWTSCCTKRLPTHRIPWASALGIFWSVKTEVRLRVFGNIRPGTFPKIWFKARSGIGAAAPDLRQDLRHVHIATKGPAPLQSSSHFAHEARRLCFKWSIPAAGACAVLGYFCMPDDCSVVTLRAAVYGSLGTPG